VRLTIALQVRLAADRATADRTEAARRRDRIHRRVEQAIEAEGDDAEAVETLSSAVWESLTETDDADLLGRPMHEVVARICADLGVSPAGFASAFGVEPTPVILRHGAARTNEACPRAGFAGPGGPSRRDGEAGPGERTAQDGWVLGSARAVRAPPEHDGRNHPAIAGPLRHPPSPSPSSG
jgi:hypothetical protein